MQIHSYNYNGTSSVPRREQRATKLVKHIEPIVRENQQKDWGKVF